MHYLYIHPYINPVHRSCYLIAKSCSIVCDPMDCGKPSFSYFHYVPEFAQTHVHRVNDAIQPSNSLSPSSSALNLSQH